MTCTTPSGSAAGTASVLVTTAGGTNAANTLYTYVAAPTVTSIPTLSEWGMIILSGLLALFGLAQLSIVRRR